MAVAMVRSEIDLIKRRYVKARSKADLWISLLEACYHYTVPSRNLFYWTSQYQGAQKNARIYDTTAVSGLRKFASKIQGGLCPPQQRWFLFEAGSDVPEDRKEEVNAELQKITDQVYLYLRRSNFDLAFNESVFDLGIGTACLICNPCISDDVPFEFYSVNLARVALEESIANGVKTCFRWWDEIRIEDIKDLWPNATLNFDLTRAYNDDYNSTIKNLVEGIIYYPSNDEKNRYRFVLFYEDDFLIDEYMESSPWIVARWSKVTNESMGRGPVMDALPSILTLNELMRIEYAAANWNVSKPWMGYSDGVFNPLTFDLRPNTIIPVAPSASGQWPIATFPDNTNPQFMQLTSVDLRLQINQLLYADPLGPITAPQQTATEIALRQRNMAEEIGPPFTRLQTELLTPILNRIIYILQEKGLIQKIVINEKEVKVTYQSPLVVAQGQQDVSNFIQFFQVLQGIQGEDAALVNLDPIKFPAWAANKMGIDQSILIGAKKLEEFYRSKAEQQQEMEMSMLEGGGAGGQAQPAFGG